MTTGQTRVSSAGMVADAFATFLDDGFRLRTDAITARRRLVASLFAVATPLIDGGGRQVTRAVGRAGTALWRGARKTEQVGATVADEAADAGREGARAVRDAAAARRSGSGGNGDPSRGVRGPADDPADRDTEDLVDVVEVVEVVEPDPGDADRLAAESLLAAELADAEDVLATGDADELDLDEIEVDEALTDEDLLDGDPAGGEVVEEIAAEETLPEPPAVLTDATDIGGDRGEVPEDPDVVGEAAVDRIVGEPERRAARRGTARPRTASRPARRDRPREDRREATTSGRERRA